MKRAAKIFAIIGVCTLFMGIFICIAGFALGGRFSTHYGYGPFNGWVYDYAGMYGWESTENTALQEYDEEEEMMITSGFYREVTGSFDKLDIEMGFGSCVIITEEGLDRCIIEGEASKGQELQAKVDGSTLEISYGTDGSWKGWSKDEGYDHFLIRIPAKEYQYVELQADVGSIDASSLSAQKLEASAAAGSIYGNNWAVSDTCQLKAEAGSVLVEELTAKKLLADAEAGSIEAYSVNVESAELDCEVGNIILQLNRKENDYNYKIKCEMGSVDVGTMGYSGMDKTRSIDNGADKTIHIDCEMGSVELTFHE